MARTFASAYLQEETTAKALLPLPAGGSFLDKTTRVAVVKTAASRSYSTNVAEILEAQHRPWGLHDAQRHHLDLLARGGVATVVTGQQVGFCLGPLYTFYKAATAIQMARALSEESGISVIPIFWLQTEDHDFPEIATCYTPQASASPLALALPHSHEWRSSVAHAQLDASVEASMAQLAESLHNLPHAAESMALWNAHYRPGHSVAGAFAGALNALFADQGLLLLNPRDPAFGATHVALHRKALFEAPKVQQLLHEREQALTEAGFAVQIPMRSGSTLSFYHPDGITGDRYRVMWDEEGFSLAGHSARLSHAQAAEQLESSPLQWSSSALLRPLIQDHLLPTAAIVGGPGEISYYAQLPPLYEWLQCPMPMIVPRARFVLLEGAVQNALRACGGSIEMLKLSERELAMQLTLDNLPGPDPEQIRAAFLPAPEALASIEALLDDLDPNLHKSFEKTKQSIEQSAEKFAQKIQQMRLHRDRQRFEQIEHARARVFPLDKPQERIFSLPYFFARYGIAPFKQLILSSIRPFDGSLQELRL